MEKLFSKLAGRFFNVFELTYCFIVAYLQQPVYNESSKILTLNALKRLFNVFRLTFGVKYAPGMFSERNVKYS